MNATISFIVKYKIPILLSALVILVCIVFRNHLADLYILLTDRQSIKEFIEAFGAAAPAVFIGFQILQVMFAPVPGEISGFVGGYLFGTTLGFVYSSIGLAVGSAINFWVGRLLGDRFVRRIIPRAKFEKFDRFISRQGVFIVLPLFIFPGFPKDYLCLFLGISTLPFKLFILLAGFGRMPGTLMLSLQGEFLFKQNYTVMAVIGIICLIIILLSIRYRKSVYRWIEQINQR